MRTAARVDKNQPEITKAFRERGWSVLIISQLKNCCDIIVAKNGRTICVEIKDGEKPPSAQKLTKGEQEFRSRWLGDYVIVNCLADVDRLSGGWE